QDGALYGTTYNGVNGVGTVFTIQTNGAGYGVVWSFSNTVTGAQNPSAPLLQGSDGVLYGTTQNGGTNSAGAIFRVTTNGTGYSILYSFGVTATDGQTPTGPLVQGADGALYGTTLDGGTNSWGTVFKINPNGGGYSQLYSFSGAPNDGASAA